MITSCVILNYNDSQTTIELLNTIRDYSELNYIVIIDNKSTDNSYIILKKYETKKIYVILAEYNGGYGYGNNIGIKYAYINLKSEYILIANPDVMFSNTCVRKLRESLINRRECIISAPVQMKPNGEKQKIIAWKLPTMKQEILTSSIILNKLINFGMYYDKEYFSNKESCYVDVIQGAMLMVNSKTMIEYGMYDEDFFLYVEEQVLAKKAKKYSYKSLLLLDCFYIHKHSISINKNYKSIIKRSKLMLDSKLLYLKKYEKLSGMKYYCTSIFFKILLIERWIIYIMRNILNKGT